MEILREGPATPDEVAKRLGTAWATAQGRLLRLVGTGRVLAIRKGRVNVYTLSSSAGRPPKVPTWAKSRPLEDLAKELEGHFPPDLSAAEMIEADRRGT